MRYVVVPALMAIFYATTLQAGDPMPSYQLTDSTVVKTREKVAGHIGACLMGQRNKPKILFGLTKELDGDPQFTFLVLFRTGKKECKPTGVGGSFQSDGEVTKIKDVYSLGDIKLPLTLETKRDPNTNNVIESKVVVGNVEVSGKEPGIVIVDLTGDKLSYKRLKVALPTCKINLADENHKTWVKAIDEAIAELKKKSKDLTTLAD